MGQTVTANTYRHVSTSKSGDQATKACSLVVSEDVLKEVTVDTGEKGEELILLQDTGSIPFTQTFSLLKMEALKTRLKSISDGHLVHLELIHIFSPHFYTPSMNVSASQTPPTHTRGLWGRDNIGTQPFGQVVTSSRSA